MVGGGTAVEAGITAKVAAGAALGPVGVPEEAAWAQAAQVEARVRSPAEKAVIPAEVAAALE
ncbi:MAG: hypothetical protein ACXWVC_07895 [Rhodoplanes sp.]